MGECREECRDECRDECCPPPRMKCCPRQECIPCPNEGGNGLGILILLVVLYFLFCGNNDKGGLFGGLF